MADGAYGWEGEFPYVILAEGSYWSQTGCQELKGKQNQWHLFCFGCRLCDKIEQEEKI